MEWLASLNLFLCFFAICVYSVSCSRVRFRALFDCWFWTQTHLVEFGKEQFVLCFQGTGTVFTSVSGREERQTAPCIKFPWNPIVRMDLGAAWNTLHHSLVSYGRRLIWVLFVRKAMPCYLWVRALTAGMEKKTKNKPLWILWLQITALIQVPSGLSWSNVLLFHSFRCCSIEQPNADLVAEA